MHWGHVSGRVVNGRVLADVCGCDLGSASSEDAPRRDDRSRREKKGRKR